VCEDKLFGKALYSSKVSALSDSQIRRARACNVIAVTEAPVLGA
jgi:hypothetical protein